MIWYIWLAYICGTFTTFLVMCGMIKHMRKVNAHLRNESDYYFMLNKVLFKNLHHNDQELFNLDPEVKRIKKTYQDNEKRINRTGKY